MSAWTPELQRAFRKQKSALTRALNAKDWPKVIALSNAFFAYYHERDVPVPDDWHRWERAHDDARYKLQLQQAGI